MSLTRTLLPAFLVLSLCGIAACNNEPSQNHPAVAGKKIIGEQSGDLFSKEAFSKKLSASLNPVDTLDSIFRRKGVTLSNALAYSYQRAAYKPFWVEEGGVTEAAATLIEELDSLKFDGLNPEKYGFTKLSRQLEQLKKGKSSIDEVIAFDTACTQSYLRASRNLLFGVLTAKAVDDQWFHTNDTVWNAPSALYNALSIEGKYIDLTSYRPLLPTYAMLRNDYRHYESLRSDGALKNAKLELSGTITPAVPAVQSIIKTELPWAITNSGDTLDANRQMVRIFQEANGLTPTGKTDSLTIHYLARQPDSVLSIIAANMERIRWLPRQFEEQYVIVNVPLMELYYRKGSENAFNMRVVVGKPARQTPTINADMANVVFSPPWGVPPTILKQEVLPGIARRGGNYLARKGLKAYDRRGKMVNASSINAKNFRSFSFRQPPGARNALGEVKFNLPNKWDIYLHDTPHREDFVKRYRAKSSGCIRVERPRDFAAFILNDIEGGNFDQLTIDSIIQTRRTKYEQLNKKIPVHILYLTAFEDSTNDHIRLLSDIYHRDAKLIAALQN